MQAKCNSLMLSVAIFVDCDGSAIIMPSCQNLPNHTLSHFQLILFITPHFILFIFCVNNSVAPKNIVTDILLDTNILLLTIVTLRVLICGVENLNQTTQEIILYYKVLFILYFLPSLKNIMCTIYTNHTPSKF